MASLSANERLFLLDMGKVKEEVDDWDLMTTQSDREKTKDKFYRLMGSAQAYLKDFPNKLKQVIDKIDGYTVQWNNWEARGSAQSKIEDRLMQTVFPTIEALVGFSEVNIPALDAARDAELTRVTDQVSELENKLQVTEAEKERAKAEGVLAKVRGKTAGFVVAGLALLGVGAYAYSKRKKKSR